MNKSYRILTGFLLVALVAAPNLALATTTFSLVPSSSGIPDYDRTYDIMATTDSRLGAMEMIIDPLLPGSIYQNYSGIPTAADDPYEAFASYVTFNSSIGENSGQTAIFGGAVDIGGGLGATFDANLIDIAWVPEPGQNFSNGTFQIGRFTLADWAEVSYNITGFEGSLGTQGTPIQGTITPVGTPSPLSLSMVEVIGPPSGYKTYDFFADITTSMGAMELMLETHHPGDIYQNNTAPDNPNPADAYASYVTVGPSGPNEPQTQVFGGAVDMVGGGLAETFNNDSLDIAWLPTPGTLNGPGLQHIARVTLHEKAEATYSLMGWQAGSDTPDTLSGTIDSLLSVSIVEAPGAPAGYTAYDFIADVSTDMGPLELILDTDTLGDIYQNTTGDDPDVGAEEFDTYVTIGGGPNPDDTEILGGAVELGGGVSETFDTQNIDITWMPTIASIATGRGVFQIARIVVDNSASGSWSLIGWQAGINDDFALTITGTIIDGEIMFFPGDVNGDGYIDGNDLSIVIGNWGKSGLGWAGGDLNGNGVVDGSDYTAVLSNWAPAEPPEAAGVPEPATMLVLALGGGLALLRRRVNL